MKLLNVFKERAPISVLITVFVACSRVGMAESAPGEPPNQMKASPGATPKNHLVVVPEARSTGSSSSLDPARVVVSHVGIYDMLRVEHDPNGAFNVTEFGTVKRPAELGTYRANRPC